MARRQKRLRRKLSLIRQLKQSDPEAITKLKKIYFVYGGGELFTKFGVQWWWWKIKQFRKEWEDI